MEKERGIVLRPMRTHKRQHTIPDSYLAAWVDPVTPPGQTPAIWRISKDRSTKKRRSPKKSFTQTDRYTIRMKDGTRDLTVEHSLDQIENDFQSVLMAIRRREKLTLRQRAKLCIFAAAMMGRSKKQGDFWQEQWTARIEKVKCMEQEFKPTQRPLLSQQLQEVNQNSHAHLVTALIKSVAPVLLTMPLTIFTTKSEDGFITSDAPLAMYNPKAHTFPLHQPGLLQANVEVTLPLSPLEVAFFSHKPTDRLYTPIPMKLVDEINRTTYFFSSAEFVSWKGNTREAWFEEREGPPDAWKDS